MPSFDVTINVTGTITVNPTEDFFGSVGPSVWYDFAGTQSLVPINGAGPTLSITRASANATRFNHLGLIETVTTDGERFNWTPNTQQETGWEVDLSGFGSVGDGTGAGTREAVAARTGGFGAQLLTDSTDGDFVRLTNSSYSQPTGRVVTDVWFYVVGTNDAGFEVATEGWTGSKRHLTSIRWIDDTGFTERLQYWDRNTDNWTAVPGGAITLSRNAWHHLQVVIDWEILEYIEVILDGTSYPMTGIPIEDVDNAAAAFMQVSLFAWTYSSNPLTIYMDDFRLAYPSCDGLLIEESRENFAATSEALDGWTEVATATVVANSGLAPDGEQTADDVTYGASEWMRRWTSTNTITDAIDVTGSSFGRSDTGTEVFRLGAKDSVAGEQKSGDLTCTKDWQRFDWTFQYGAAGGANEFAMNNEASGSGSNPTLWGQMIEEGSFATSYVGGGGTRAADVTSATVTNQLGASNTLYVSARTGEDQDCVLLQIDDGTESERYRIARVSGDIHVITTDGGSDVADLNLGAVADNTDFKVAARFKTNDFAASLDGGAPVTDSGGALPTVTTLRVGMDTSGDEWNGIVAEVKLWPDGKDNSSLMIEST